MAPSLAPEPWSTTAPKFAVFEAFTTVKSSEQDLKMEDTALAAVYASTSPEHYWHELTQFYICFNILFYFQ